MLASTKANTTTRPRRQIGEWWVDPAANELRRAGETVRIEPKAMEVLMLLAEHGDRVVSREELLKAVWPGVVVGDEALTQSIIKLRRALGDDPRAPSYIETIPKRGYRLIAPVVKSENIESVRDDAVVVPQQLPQAAPRRNRSLSWIVGIVFVLIAAGATSSHDCRLLQRRPPVQTSSMPETGAGQTCLP